MVSIKNQKIVFFLITGLVVLLDQLTKYFFLRFQPVWNLKFLTFHLVKNTGAGFGILKEYTWLLTVISAVVVILILYLYPRLPKDKINQVFTALLLGGTFGNLLDRAFRKFVVDFVDLSFWPAFNLADAAITLGIIGLVISLWKKY